MLPLIEVLSGFSFSVCLWDEKEQNWCNLFEELCIILVCLICVLGITVMAYAVRLLIELCMSSQNLKIQMKDFEATAEPLQEWLTTTEKMIQGSSSRLHDLPSKRREQQKLQVTSYEPV